MANSQPNLLDHPNSRKDVSQKKVREMIRPAKVTEVKPHNSRGRGRSNEEKRKSYSEYRERKKKAIEFEKTNHQYLMLWPASDKDINKETTFYNMGGNSAIIYVHEIGPRLKRKPTLRTDMDHGNKNEKFTTGICSIANLSLLEKKLGEIGISREETKDPNLVLFKLNREYPDKEIEEMLKLEQKRVDAMNKTIYVKVLYPDIHKQILELKKLIPPKVKNMDKTYREVVGMELIKTLMTLVRLYSQMVHGDMDEKEAATKMLLEADMILEEISIMSELRLWDISFCIRLADITNGLRQLLKGKIINKCD